MYSFARDNPHDVLPSLPKSKSCQKTMLHEIPPIPLTKVAANSLVRLLFRKHFLVDPARRVTHRKDKHKRMHLVPLSHFCERNRYALCSSFFITHYDIPCDVAGRMKLYLVLTDGVLRHNVSFGLPNCSALACNRKQHENSNRGSA